MDAVNSGAETREGYLRNRYGDSIKRESIHERHLREHDLVVELIREAEEMRGLLALFKAKCFDDIDTYRRELGDRYGARVGGTRGGLTLKSFDDTLQITISQADTMTFGPELESAKALIDECLQEWTQGGNENLSTVVNDAFHVGENKKVRMDRVLGLRRLRIKDDDRWDRAMMAINDAVRTERSKLYVRLYRRETLEGELKIISLDLAKV